MPDPDKPARGAAAAGGTGAAPDAVTAVGVEPARAVGGRGRVPDSHTDVREVVKLAGAGNEDDIKGYSILLARHVAILGAGSLRRQSDTYTMKDVSMTT